MLLRKKVVAGAPAGPVAQFLNAMFSCFPSPRTFEGWEALQPTDPLFQITMLVAHKRVPLEAGEVWKAIEDEVVGRYGTPLHLWSTDHTVPVPVQAGEGTAAHMHVRGPIGGRTALLRRFCQRAGLRIRARDFDYNSAVPFCPDVRLV
jgi:hypothetical protein